jgi:3-hydroxyacyl-CoA dehydrogenase
MIPRLRSVVVLGAGTMGAQLACLLAGVAGRVHLLDMDAAIAAAGIERATKLKPSPLQSRADAERIVPGGFTELEAVIRDADWVLEAVVERLEPKRELLERVDGALASVETDAAVPLVSSNTSGLSIARLADGRSERFRRAFLGTHFFNPPRYARLLELIPTPDTDPVRLRWIEELGARHLGKGTVRAKDRPAFIANRLGVHGLLTALALAQELDLGVDEVDELTGPLIERPKSAIFRTLDLVGLDVAVAVADHCHEELVDDPDRERFVIPSVLRRLVEEGRMGEKTGAGFYQKVEGEILALDLATLDYRPRRRLSSRPIEAARSEPDLGRRLVALAEAAVRAPDDRAACFLWRLTADELAYSAVIGPEVADDAGAVDRALRWGFGWRLGPFEMWDLLGPERVLQRLPASGVAAPPLAQRVAAGPGRFTDDGRALDFATLELRSSDERPGVLDLDRRRRSVPELPSNASATLLDLGEAILGLELHGKLNIIGLDTLDLLRRGLDLAATRYDGFVVGTRAADFSAGANLALLLIEAEEGEWDELDRSVRLFQGVTSAMRTVPVPVVVSPRGRTLGGGAEFCLGADGCQPLAETYIGLVETGLGLIPGGGGSTAMARRVAERIPEGVPADPFPFFRAVLENIALARVSTSAEEGRALGYLGPADLITADPDRQWADAVATARHLAEVGYRAPGDRPFPVLGRRGIAAAEALTYNQLLARQMSEHDRRVVLDLARVMSGGDVAEGTLLPPRHLLDLERETFLGLLGERLTRERIRHILKTGKPLRN